MSDRSSSMSVKTAGCEIMTILERHAESQHKYKRDERGNLIVDMDMVNPGITRGGKLDCMSKRAMIIETYGGEICQVYCSPLKRAIETAALLFGELIQMGLRVILLPELQSFADGPNGKTGTSEELRKQYPWLKVGHMGRKLIGTEMRKVFFKDLFGHLEMKHTGRMYVFMITHSSVIREVFNVKM